MCTYTFLRSSQSRIVDSVMGNLTGTLRLESMQISLRRKAPRRWPSSAWLENDPQERHGWNELTPSASETGKPTCFNCSKAYAGCPGQHCFFRVRTCVMWPRGGLFIRNRSFGLISSHRLGRALAEMYLLLH